MPGGRIMKIKTIEIRNIVGGNLKGNTENIRHIKATPHEDEAVEKFTKK